MRCPGTPRIGPRPRRGRAALIGSRQRSRAAAPKLPRSTSGGRPAAAARSPRARWWRAREGRRPWVGRGDCCLQAPQQQAGAWDMQQLMLMSLQDEWGCLARAPRLLECAAAHAAGRHTWHRRAATAAAGGTLPRLYRRLHHALGYVVELRRWPNPGLAGGGTVCTPHTRVRGDAGVQ